METESKQERIIAAALKLFSQQGYHKTAVSEIADEAEVAKGTVYWYFDSKQDLFQGILLSGIKKLNQRIEEKVTADQLAEEKLEEIIKLVLEFFANSQEVSKMYQENTVSISPEFKENMLDLRRQSVALTTQVIEEGKQEGTIRKDLNSKEAANLLQGMISVYNPHFCEQRKDIEAKQAVIEDLFFNGVKA